MSWRSVESAPKDGSEFYAKVRRSTLYTDPREGYVYFDDRVRQFRWCDYRTIADVAEWLPVGELP